MPTVIPFATYGGSVKQVPGTCFMYGEPRRRLPTSQSLCTSVFRAICGEWGNTSDALHKSAKWQEKMSQIDKPGDEVPWFTLIYLIKNARDWCTRVPLCTRRRPSQRRPACSRRASVPVVTQSVVSRLHSTIALSCRSSLYIFSSFVISFPFSLLLYIVLVNHCKGTHIL